jgi:hypothetical protein
MPFDSLVYAYKKTGAVPIDIGRAYRLNSLSIKTLIATAKPPDCKLLETMPPYIQPPPNSLEFESRFESGNLAFASRVSPVEYNLLMSSDVNSRGHTQWFFFRVARTIAGQTVKFNLINFEKPASLYNEGMKVLYYSSTSYALTTTGWRRGGQDIAYYRNGITRHVTCKSYYTLTFTFTFEYSDDSVYFAYSFPYFYSELQEYLDSLERSHETCSLITRKLLCRTLAGNRCDYVTITNPCEVEGIDKRKGIVLSARVHPGETVGSWMMQGALEFLVSRCPEAELLRSLYVFKIVPMLNPDGVIRGNHRCSLAGCDLNRNWKRPKELTHPEISSFKRLIKVFASKFPLEMVCDMHGHSRKSDVFMYGCNDPRNPAAFKLFPYIVSKISSIFSFKGCRFGLQKSKEATLRISLFKELRLPTVYTCEASFCGASTGKYAGLHFTTDLLKQMGKDLCMSLLVHSHQLPKVPRDTLQRAAKKGHDVAEGTDADVLLSCTAIASLAPEASSLAKEELLNELQLDEALLYHGEEMDSSDDSDSAPSEDDLSADELAELLPRSEFKLNKKKQPFRPVKSTDRGLESRKEVKVRLVLNKPKPVKAASTQQTELEPKVTRVASDSPLRRMPVRPTAAPAAHLPSSPPTTQALAKATAAPSTKQLAKALNGYYVTKGKQMMDQSTQTPLYLNKKRDNTRASERSRATLAHISKARSGDVQASFYTKSNSSVILAPEKFIEQPYIPQQILVERPLRKFAEISKHSSEKRIYKVRRHHTKMVVTRRPDTQSTEDLLLTGAMMASGTLRSSHRTPK